MRLKEGKAPTRIWVDGRIRVRMIQLGIDPARIANAAFRREIRRLEKKEELAQVQRLDPRVDEARLYSTSKRIRRLRRLAGTL